MWEAILFYLTCGETLAPLSAWHSINSNLEKHPKNKNQSYKIQNKQEAKNNYHKLNET